MFDNIQQSKNEQCLVIYRFARFNCKSKDYITKRTNIKYLSLKLSQKRI